ncbi:hypothetical protein KSP40_PGU005489 [Platanthera guangdongensis]|uniref:Uncharacterized protein n=1 Tax=Platanthera guangdongensis TaxID=2320717 RepID=A0ABR2M936_9ASPA
MLYEIHILIDYNKHEEGCLWKVCSTCMFLMFPSVWGVGLVGFALASKRHIADGLTAIIRINCDDET